MDVVLRCTTCYPVRLSDCPDNLIFNIGLAINTVFTYEICDSMGNVYEGTTTSNGSGNISISTSADPFDDYPGLFNKFAGSFKITFFDGAGDAVPFTVSGTEYTCIAFAMKDTVEVDDCGADVICGCFFGGYGAPSDLIGSDDDFYIDSGSGVIWEKVGGVWTVFYVPTSSPVTGASNGLNLEGSNVEMGGALNEDTTVSAGAFDLNLTGLPEVGKETSFEISQDLYNLFAQLGVSVPGIGARYVLTYDGFGNPESWLYLQVIDNTAIGGVYNASIGYINLTTGETSDFQATAGGAEILTSNGVGLTGMSITRITEIITLYINSVVFGTIDATGWTVTPLAGVGTRMVVADVNGLLSTQALPATPPSFTQIDFISGVIEVPANSTYKLVVKIPYAITITETTTIAISGTCTATFLINAVALGGTANAVSVAEQSQAHASANAAAAGDDIQVTISANAACSLMSFTIKFTRTLA